MTSLKPLIVQRLEDGQTIRQIWLELRKSGNVSVALSKFYTQVDRLLHPQPAQSKPVTGQPGGGLDLFRQQQSPRPVTVSNPPAVASSPEDAITQQFDHSNRPCESDLW